MESYWKQTVSEKMGSVDGLNLFFGALLGANLGTLEHVAMGDYIQFVVLLAGTVVALRIVSTSSRRIYALVTLALYAVLILAVLAIPSMKPEGLSENALHRIVATLAVWVTFVVVMEFWPVKEDAAN
jgi:uncharacterized membrane protein